MIVLRPQDYQDRQDFVDNAIFEFVKQFIPDDQHLLEWDIDRIGKIRDNIDSWLTEQGIIAQGEFY